MASDEFTDASGAKRKLTLKQKKFCKELLECESQTEAYMRVFQSKDRARASVCAFQMMRKPYIREYVAMLKIEREDEIKFLKEVRRTALIEKTLTEFDIDVFHSEVVKGNLEVEDVMQVREYIPYNPNDPRTGRWIVSFKKIKRPPNIRERQISAAELYRRLGAYPKENGKPKFIPEEGGLYPLQQLNNGNGNGNGTGRYVILSNGEKIPI